MSAIDIDAKVDLAAARGGADEISRRARASGLVYSMSRVSATFSGFIVAYVLREAGGGGVFGPITAAMVVVIAAIATFGPNVRGKPLDA